MVSYVLDVYIYIYIAREGATTSLSFVLAGEIALEGLCGIFLFNIMFFLPLRFYIYIYTYLPKIHPIHKIIYIYIYIYIYIWEIKRYIYIYIYIHI